MCGFVFDPTSRLTPTPPESQTPVNPVLVSLRGISQIFFITDARAGGVLIAGVGFASPGAAALMLLGSLVQSWSAYILGIREDALAGKYGFNGALVGAAMVAHGGFTGTGIALTVLGSLAAVVVHQIVDKLFHSRPLQRLRLPVTTAPFCLITSAIFMLVPAAGGVELVSSSDPWTAVGLGITNSFAEVDLTAGWISGVAIFAGLLVGSVSIAVFGLAGAGLGVLAGLAVLGPEQVSSGMLSYSSLLAAAAVGAVFFPERPLVWRVLMSAGAALLTLPIVLLLGAVEAPVLTWPYILATWMVIAAVRSTEHKKSSPAR